MHNLEPYYNWRHLYIASEDEHSPFYEKEYSEFEYTNRIYNYLIHPQWDFIGSSTLYIKIIFADYDEGYAIVELLGEWNDCIHNDIMLLKREIMDVLIDTGINKFILIGENVMIFHSDTDDYYQEWFDDVEDGWIALVNFRDQVIKDFENANLDYYFAMGGKLNDLDWRTWTPQQMFENVSNQLTKRLS